MGDSPETCQGQNIFYPEIKSKLCLVYRKKKKTFFPNGFNGIKFLCIYIYSLPFCQIIVCLIINTLNKFIVSVCLKIFHISYFDDLIKLVESLKTDLPSRHHFCTLLYIWRYAIIMVSHLHFKKLFKFSLSWCKSCKLFFFFFLMV